MSGEEIFYNGIEAETGAYLRASQTQTSLAQAIAKEKQDQGLVNQMKRQQERLEKPDLELPYGVKPEIIEQAGWGIIFPAKEKAALQQKLAVLIEHRKKQVPADRFKILDFKPKEDWRLWLGNHGVSTGVTVPTKVPYYLLIAGSPQSIPFEFQHNLSLDYAVGRVYFDDPEDYRRYAESVVRYESSDQPLTSKSAAFFATHHLDDRETELSSTQLIQPLASGNADYPGGVAAQMGYQTNLFVADQALRASLKGLFYPQAPAKPPSFLFTATHGLTFRRGHPQQLGGQGALVCQDLQFGQPVTPDKYFCAADLDENARLHGLVAFLYACFSAGTPVNDQVKVLNQQPAAQLADKPFVASLPQRMLAHPAGGALAVIGHVDITTMFSIRPDEVGTQLQPFANMILRILNGEPVGHSLLSFRQRFANLGSELADLQREASAGAQIDPYELVRRWMERNDARNFIVLGDPAVKIRQST